jgi:hypothetical protein
MDLVLLDYPLNVDRALIEAEHARINSKAYSDDRFEGDVAAWQISKYNSPFIQKIMDDFGIQGKPRFYFMEPFFKLPEHVDYKTECSINFVLSENAAPVSFGDKQYDYKQCLLNTSIPHSVQNGPEERILLKISIFDVSFNDLAKRIKFRLGS